jgi:hypothetical protein
LNRDRSNHLFGRVTRAFAGAGLIRKVCNP